MGRHSASEDTEDGAPVITTEPVALSDEPGRHHAVDAAEHDSAEPESADRHDQRERATQADLRLLREHPALRAQCIAAALAPFVIYTIVLFALARVHIYVLWLWAPIIAAGILVGAALDAAHRRLDRAAGPPTTNDSS